MVQPAKLVMAWPAAPRMKSWTGSICYDPCRLLPCGGMQGAGGSPPPAVVKLGLLLRPPDGLLVVQPTCRTLLVPRGARGVFWPAIICKAASKPFLAPQLLPCSIVCLDPAPPTVHPTEPQLSSNSRRPQQYGTLPARHGRPPHHQGRPAAGESRRCPRPWHAQGPRGCLPPPPSPPASTPPVRCPRPLPPQRARPAALTCRAVAAGPIKPAAPKDKLDALIAEAIAHPPGKQHSNGNGVRLDADMEVRRHGFLRRHRQAVTVGWLLTSLRTSASNW